MSDPEWLQQARADGRITEGPTARIVAALPQSRPAKKAKKAKPLAGWSYKLAITFGLKTPSSLNSREHWRARTVRVNHERQATFDALQPFNTGLLGSNRARVRLVRLGGGRMDDDNLPGTMKAIRDQIAQNFGHDDGSDWFEWSYAQEPGGTFVGVRMEFELAAKRPKE